jgi:hypothetical protein
LLTDGVDWSICSVILGFDAPRKDDGVPDNSGPKKRQPSFFLPFSSC